VVPIAHRFGHPTIGAMVCGTLFLSIASLVVFHQLLLDCRDIAFAL